VLLATAGAVLAAACVATGEISQIGHATTWDIMAFACAGLMNFLGGWSFLNISHRRIGAARTSPLLITAPIFGAVAAAVVFRDLPSPVAFGAMVPMIVGAYVVSAPSVGKPLRVTDTLPGLATALMWGSSPIFAVEGMKGLDAPLAGVTIAMLSAVAGYGVLHLCRGSSLGLAAMDRTALAFTCLAAVLVALATWVFWLALDDTSVATVLSLNLLSVPVVLVMAPLLVGRQLENVNARVWGGSALVVTGALGLITMG
jgi:drug/metabolite transporter (DMT)-like permease